MKGLLSRLTLFLFICTINCSQSNNPLIIDNDKIHINYNCFLDKDFDIEKVWGSQDINLVNYKDNIKIKIIWSDADDYLEANASYSKWLELQKADNNNNELIALNLSYIVDERCIDFEILKIFPSIEVGKYNIELWRSIGCNGHRVFSKIELLYSKFDIGKILNEVQKYRNIEIVIK